jgi:hypothetical protein
MGSKSGSTTISGEEVVKVVKLENKSVTRLNFVNAKKDRADERLPSILP